jgi:hypothetical protein
MIEFNDRREDVTKDWRVGKVKEIMANQRQQAIYDTGYITPVSDKALQKAEKQRKKRIAKVKKNLK